MDSHLGQCHKAIGSRNGVQLAALLAIPITAASHTAVHGEFVKRAQSGGNISNICASALRDEYLSILAFHFVQTLVNVSASSWSAAVDSSLAMYTALLDFLKEDGSAWVLPVLLRLSNDIRLLAMHGDAATAGDEFIRRTLEHLTKGFTAVIKDRTPVTQPGSKKVALFAVTSVLFKIYFKVNTLQLCSKLINVIEVSAFRNGALQHHSCYPVADVVMYYYYLGRLKLFEDRYGEARDCLLLALRHVPRTAACMRNRQRIMVNLVAVNVRRAFAVASSAAPSHLT